MGPLTPIIGLRLLALAAGLRHNAEIGQPGLCFSAYGHKFGINHLAAGLIPTPPRRGEPYPRARDGTTLPRPPGRGRTRPPPAPPPPPTGRGTRRRPNPARPPP